MDYCAIPRLHVLSFFNARDGYIISSFPTFDYLVIATLCNYGIAIDEFVRGIHDRLLRTLLAELDVSREDNN